MKFFKCMEIPIYFRNHANFATSQKNNEERFCNSVKSVWNFRFPSFRNKNLKIDLGPHSLLTFYHLVSYMHPKCPGVRTPNATPGLTFIFSRPVAYPEKLFWDMVEVLELSIKSTPFTKLSLGIGFLQLGSFKFTRKIFRKFFIQGR